MKFWCDGMARAFNLCLISRLQLVMHLYLLPPPSCIPLIDMADACIPLDLLAYSSVSMQSDHQNKCKATELTDEISAMLKR